MYESVRYHSTHFRRGGSRRGEWACAWIMLGPRFGCGCIPRLLLFSTRLICCFRATQMRSLQNRFGYIMGLIWWLIRFD
jgi:hypothetical protein